MAVSYALDMEASQRTRVEPMQLAGDCYGRCRRRLHERHGATCAKVPVEYCYCLCQ